MSTRVLHFDKIKRMVVLSYMRETRGEYGMCISVFSYLYFHLLGRLKS